MAILIHSASCKSFFQVELARKEGGEFGKRPRVDGGVQGGGGGGKQLVKPLSVQICFFLNESNFEPLYYFTKNGFTTSSCAKRGVR